MNTHAKTYTSQGTEADLTPPAGYALLQDDDAVDGADGNDDRDDNTIVDEQGNEFPSEEGAAQVRETRDSNEEGGVSEEEQYRREVQAAAIRLAKAVEQEGDLWWWR